MIIRILLKKRHYFALKRFHNKGAFPPLRALLQGDAGSAGTQTIRTVVNILRRQSALRRMGRRVALCAYSSKSSTIMGMGGGSAPYVRYLEYVRCEDAKHS